MKLLPLKSPAASANPNWSKLSGGSPTWVNSCPPAVVSPLAEPYRTLTTPWVVLVTLSIGAPTAKSANPLLLKSPAAMAQPNQSSASTAPPTWVNSCPPLVESPPPEPYRTLTTPASSLLATSSKGVPAARSAKPLLLKSPAAKVQPNQSPRSGLLPTWVNSCPPAVVGRRASRTGC